jgi:hypothetical protein
VRPMGLGVLATLVLLSPALLTPALAQQFKHRGGAAPAAPRISTPAPAPRISAPAISAPRFSAPARHIAAPAPHMAAPRFSGPRTPQIAAPRLPARQIASPRGAASRLARERGGQLEPAGLATRHAPNLAPQLPNAPAGRAARQVLTPSTVPHQGARGSARTAMPRSLLGNVGTATPSTGDPQHRGSGTDGPRPQPRRRRAGARARAQRPARRAQSSPGQPSAARSLMAPSGRRRLIVGP